MTVTPTLDLLVRGSRIVFENGMYPGCIGVKDGRIVLTGERDLPCTAVREIDAGDDVVFPGVVDPHVHYKDPGPGNFREDYFSGSKQAAAGGVTTAVEMPLSVPMVTDAATFDIKLAVAEKASVVDFALWGGLNKFAEGHYLEMHAKGCVSYKVFLSTDPDSPRIGDYDLLEAMKVIAGFDGLVGVHAENADITDRLIERFRAENRNDGPAHMESRPDIAELEALQRILLFAQHTGCRLHVCHLSTAKARGLLQWHRSLGTPFTVETVPAYLTLDVRDLARCGAHAKCNPPVRSPENREALWDMLLAGEIDMIGSDHCPYVDADRTKDSFWDVPPGLSGIDLMLPLLIDEGVHRRGLSFTRLAELLAAAPAKRFGLYPQKGALRTGADADMVFVDPDATWTWTWENNLGKSQSRHTPFEGRSLKGKVRRTLVRGNTVYEDGKILVQPGYGKLVKPHSAA